MQGHTAREPEDLWLHGFFILRLRGLVDSSSCAPSITVTSDEGKASTVAEPPLLLSVFFMLPHALHQEKEQAHQYYYSQYYSQSTASVL